MSADGLLELDPASSDVLERGNWLNVKTRGAAVRFAVAQAAFLDRLLQDDEIVDDVVERLNGITGAPALILELTQAFGELEALAIAEDVVTADGDIGSRGWDDLDPGSRARHLAVDAKITALLERHRAIVAGSSRLGAGPRPCLAVARPPPGPVVPAKGPLPGSPRRMVGIDASRSH
jgi:hypothetical protein